MEYKVKELSCKSLILTQGDIELASLNYKGWASSNSEIVLVNGGQKFSIESKSMWKSTFVIRQNEQILLTYIVNWNGTLSLKSNNNNPESDFTMKSKGFWGKSFVLLDKRGNVLAEITPIYNWKTLKSNYSIQATSEFDQSILRDLLFLTMVHYIRYYTAMAVAVM